MVAALEELINTLYEMVQEARSVPLSSEKCMIERDKALDLIEEIRQSLPADLKMAKEIVEKRDEIIAASKRESEAIHKKAEEYVRKTVAESEVVAQANAQASEIVARAQSQAEQLRASVTAYCEDKLNTTEACVAATLEEVKKCHARFTGAANSANAPKA
ncbi:MAG: hypothetical protein ACI4PQ_05275 [Butyricicoccaceae bacterium]